MKEHRGTLRRASQISQMVFGDGCRKEKAVDELVDELVSALVSAREGNPVVLRNVTEAHPRKQNR